MDDFIGAICVFVLCAVLILNAFVLIPQRTIDSIGFGRSLEKADINMTAKQIFAAWQESPYDSTVFTDKCEFNKFIKYLKNKSCGVCNE